MFWYRLWTCRRVDDEVNETKIISVELTLIHPIEHQTFLVGLNLIERLLV